MKASDAKKKSKYKYDEMEKKITYERRKYNIESFINLIKNDINIFNLKYEDNDKTSILYFTEEGEKIGINYPGKESLVISSKGEKKSPDKIYPYDMKPVLYSKNGVRIKNLNFGDLYEMVEEIREKHNDSFLCVLSIIFKMGYMVDVELAEKNIYDLDGNQTSSKIKYYDFDFNTELMDYLNDQIEVLNTKTIDGEKMKVSFRAFLIYFYLLFQQEDNKYCYKKQMEVKDYGRTSTAKSVFLFAAVLQGKTNVAKALQSFINGKSIGKCDYKSIPFFTDNIISFTDIKQEIIDLGKINKILIEKKKTENNGEKISYLECKKLNLLVADKNEDFNIINEKNFKNKYVITQKSVKKKIKDLISDYKKNNQII